MGSTQQLSENQGTSSLMPSDDPSVPASCEVESLDAYVHDRRLSRVDLIKTDTEGAEHAVLLGAIDTPRTFHACVYLGEAQTGPIQLDS